eukprot:RCo037728
MLGVFAVVPAPNLPAQVRDWHSPDFEIVVSSLTAKGLLTSREALGRSWELLCQVFSRFCVLWQSYTPFLRRLNSQTTLGSSDTPSLFVYQLRELLWIPSSVDTLRCSGHLYTDLVRASTLLGDRAPDLSVACASPPAEMLRELGMMVEVTVPALINELMKWSNEAGPSFTMSLKRMRRILMQLTKELSRSRDMVISEFQQSPLLWIPDSPTAYSNPEVDTPQLGRFYYTRDCCWKDDSRTCGNRISSTACPFPQ